MALPTLNQSEDATREACQVLIDAELPRSWKVAQRDIEIAEDARDGDRRQLLVRWPGGRDHVARPRSKPEHGSAEQAR